MTTKATTPISAAQALRRAQQEGTIWRAPNGVEIRVRELDLADHAMLDQFPDELRQMVYRALERTAALAGDDTPDEEADNLFAGLSGEELLRKQEGIADALCRLAWINPAIVDEITDPESQVLLDEVPGRIRRAFMAHVFGMQAAEAQSLATFPR